MKTSRTMAMAVGAALLAAGAFAAPSVEITSVQQQYPWTNTVDIVYTVAGVESETNGYFVVFTPTTSTGAAIPDVNGETSVQVALKGSGVYSTQWFPQTNLQYTACKMTPAVYRGGSGGGKDYMIVDLLTGAVAYEPMATQEASNERYNTQEFKTTKMVLRRIEAGEYDIMEGAATAAMAKPYYIGIFEVTEGQYNAMVGSGATTSRLPKGNISWNTIRSSALVVAQISDSGSGPLAGLNRKVHTAGNAALYFDLPTESMWMVAERAKCPANWCRHFGTTSVDDTTNLGDYAWYNNNSGGSIHEVGTRKPNQWGLYDMLGNSWELSRDGIPNIGSWNTTANNTSYLSLTQTPASSGTRHVCLGGAYCDGARGARSSCRDSDPGPNSTWRQVGFRVAVIVE